MTDQMVKLIIGLAGITATLIASGLGLYFTAKARSSPLREALFSKQIELISQIVHKQSRFRVYATLLHGNDDTYKKRARKDIATCFREFSELQEEGAAVLPTEVWVEIKRLADHMCSTLDEYDEKRCIEDSDFTNLVARMTKVALVSRVVFGIDELTGESLSLFSSLKDYERITNMEIKAFEEIHDTVNENA